MIAVLGATGRIGRPLAEALADTPGEAIAVVRRPEASDLPIPARRGDLTDPASIRAALDGVSRLFLLTPHGPDQDLHESVVIDAAIASSVQHIVKVSGGTSSLGPNGTTSTGTSHWLSEQRIERSGIGFTFLRPSFFQQNLLTTVAPVVAKTGLLLAPFGHAPIAMIDTRDIAACAAAALTDPAPLDHAWQLTGPRGVTFDQIAAHLGVRYIPIRPTMAGRALSRQGAPATEVDHAVRMAAYFAAGADSAPTDSVLRLTGRAPRPVYALLDEHRDRFLPTTGLARVLSHTATSKD